MFALNKIRMVKCKSCNLMCPRDLHESAGECEHCTNPLEGSLYYVEDEERFLERCHAAHGRGEAVDETIWG